jgi:glycosyltransferase involved in cell wall biosynthesis
MRDKNPLISVLMTAYNREPLISLAIESVLRQSYDNWELIILDDCSVDRTFELSKEYANNDKRIQVYKNEKNLGDYANRNEIVNYSNGLWIKYLDSDDAMSADCLELMIKETWDSNVSIIISARNDVWPRNGESIVLYPKESLKIHFFQFGFLDSAPSKVMISKELFLRYGKFSGKRNVSDLEMWLKIALTEPIAVVKSSLVFWRDHEVQEYKLDKLSYLIHEYQIIKSVIQNTNEQLDNRQKKFIINKYQFYAFKGIVKYIRSEKRLRRSFELFSVNEIDISVFCKYFFIFVFMPKKYE